ncbi:MAG: LytR C-terminal domain-containing protein [Candidatus Moranbacteria bacterium]|nr:LytR C-terminal domain-containing protein [Candidatus Moranbacteria bacterium]
MNKKTSIEKIFAEKKSASVEKPKKVVAVKKRVVTRPALKKVSPARIVRRAPIEKTAESVVVEKSKSKRKINLKMNKKLVLILVGVAVLTGLGTGGGFLYKHYYNKKVDAKQQLVAAESNVDAGKKEVDALKETIGVFFELPTNEEPILATVTDIEKIKEQNFFARAQNGDKVLIYTENKKAILFRPSNNKIIEVSPVSGTDAATDANAPASSPESASTDNATPVTTETPAEVVTPAKAAIFNGSKTKGLAQKIGEMVALIPGVTVSEKTNAKGNYEKTTVIDLSGTHADLAQKIATSLNGEVGTITDNETKPNADILVIGGSDFKVN